MKVAVFCNIALCSLVDQKERDLLEDRGVDGRMGSEWLLGRLAGGVQSGSSWLRIGTGGGLL
jgi:hypothetical protein